MMIVIKYLALAVIVLFCGAAGTFGQSDKEIAAIRREVALIEKNAAGYDKRTKILEGISLEGTEATYFTSGRGLKKIAARMYGESYRTTVEIYYSGEYPIFIFQKVERYVMPIPATGSPKIAKVAEKRLYRSGLKTIRLLTDKTELKPGNVEYDEAEMQLIERADELKARFDQ